MAAIDEPQALPKMVIYIVQNLHSNIGHDTLVSRAYTHIIYTLHTPRCQKKN